MGVFDKPQAARHNPCHTHPCPHCDTEPFDPQACSHCAAIWYGSQAAARALATRPQPDAGILHDTGSLLGAVDRCPRCGARTYQTATGPWCPRAYCLT
jgi:hypothetical protein